MSGGERRPEKVAYRGDAPVWRQAAEGMGLVLVLSLAVAGAGGVLALIVSLIF